MAILTRLAIADFMPLGAPASNLTGPNFTPPFPAYPSGHAGFGGDVFQIMRRFYGTDNIAFTFVSDEFNGQTARPQRKYPALSAAQFFDFLTGRGRERAEPDLPRHPLALRQDARELPWVAAWAITCSIMPSRRLLNLEAGVKRVLRPSRSGRLKKDHMSRQRPIQL